MVLESIHTGQLLIEKQAWKRAKAQAWASPADSGTGGHTAYHGRCGHLFLAWPGKLEVEGSGEHA